MQEQFTTTLDKSVIISYIPGRIRFKIERLYKDNYFSIKIKNHLSGIDGIKQIKINNYSKSLLIYFDESKITVSMLKNKIQSYLLNYKTANYELIETKSKAAVTSISNPIEDLSVDEIVKSKNILSHRYYQNGIRKINPIQSNNSQRKKCINDQWHLMSISQIIDLLNTDELEGLSQEQAEILLSEIGLNEFENKKKKSFISNFLEQFDSFIVKLLLGASVVSAFLGQLGDSITIIVIVLLEAILGVWQNNKAEKSLEALKSYSASKSKVIRDCETHQIASSHLVPGDIILFEAGDIIPADARLIESSQLKIDESSLTGESEAVDKSYKISYSSPVTLGDRKNIVYMGTTVLKGTGKAVVLQTGRNTELGNIAKLIGDDKITKTPLQKDLDGLGKYITWACLGMCGGIMLSGIIGGQSFIHMLRTGVSLAIGAIPEGLTTVFTISLAFGVQRMAKKRAIIKRLPAVESLSCVDVICTDKTGTLTTGKMTVTEIETINKNYTVTGEGYSTKGDFYYNNFKVDVNNILTLNKLLTIGGLCNNASYKVKNNCLEILGDHTEGALLVAAYKADVNLEGFNCYTRVKEFAFDSEIKKMTVVCKDTDNNYTVNMKGAPDIVLSKCSKILDGKKVRQITKEDIDKIKKSICKMASKALRVIGFAYKDIDKFKECESAIENDLVFVGLAGMIDPPREHVKSAIKKCKKAGIKVIMITGDHKKTAEAVARQIKILDDKSIILTGEELDSLSDKELLENIDNVTVFARTSPHQKLRIVKALKQKDHIVAMTGDGVNDAPAIKEADIGIAMGKNGTNVTRESSSIILTDDNFITIVKAIEEGRGISGNVKKFLRYVLSGNVGEVLAIFLASIAGLPTPLIASQILMINLITEGIPALSLGVDPPNDNVMSQPPRNADKSIFDRKLLSKILSRGFMMGISTLGIYTSTLLVTGNLIKARTLAYANLITNQMFHVFDCRTAPLSKNKYVVPSVAISSSLLLATIYIPQLMGFFGTCALGLSDWLFILFMASFIGRLDYIKEQAAKLVQVRVKEQSALA